MSRRPRRRAWHRIVLQYFLNPSAVVASSSCWLLTSPTGDSSYPIIRGIEDALQRNSGNRLTVPVMCREAFAYRCHPRRRCRRRKRRCVEGIGLGFVDRASGLPFGYLRVFDGSGFTVSEPLG